MSLPLKNNELFLQQKNDLVREVETQGKINIKHNYNINKAVLKLIYGAIEGKEWHFYSPLVDDRKF